MRIALITVLIAVIPHAVLATCTWPPSSPSGNINECGSAGAPVSISACSGGASQIITGSRVTVNWAVFPEGGDMRCELGTVDNIAPTITPTATVGFLIKAGTLMPEQTISQGSSMATLRLDCCGVSGAVSVDTWHE